MPAEARWPKIRTWAEQHYHHVFFMVAYGARSRGRMFDTGTRDRSPISTVVWLVGGGVDCMCCRGLPACPVPALLGL
jgi:hypothetical protein